MAEPPNLRVRKVAELRHKLESVSTELERWQEASIDAKAPLAKHHTQVERISRQLRSLAKSVWADLEPLTHSDAPVLAECRAIEIQILELHRIWEFFRGKLAQRYVEGLRPYLAAADDFAWACYQPAQMKVKPEHVERLAIREPPLVFFNGGSSPFAMSRGYAYQAEAVPGEAMSTDEFRKVLRSLPIPVIGVPWFQAEHLPDALVIGHEVGHNVEDDFRLTARLQTLLHDALKADQIEPKHHGAWESWLGEVFADTWGILSTGPAFVGSLIDFLALDRRSIVEERMEGPYWGAYPTSALRVLYGFEVLDLCGFSAQAKALRNQWSKVYPSHAMIDFEDDLATVARGLIEGSYPELGGVSLKDVLVFAPGQQRAAERDAAEMIQSYPPKAREVRTLLAGARLAFAKDPGAYREKGIPERVLERIEQIRETGTRRGGGTKRPDPADLARHDRQAGHALRRRILRP